MKSLVRLTPFALLVVAGCAAIDGIFGNSSTCASATAYIVGTSTSGTMGQGNCRGPTGADGQLYSFTVSAQTNIKVMVATSAFTPALALFTSTNKAIGATTLDGTLRAFLPAGSYQIFVSTNSGKGGAYTLTTPNTALGGCTSSTGSIADSDVGFTIKGATFTGQITESDCGALNAKTHWYRVPLSGSDTLSTSVTVDKPAGLYFLDTSGAVIVTKELPAAGSWSYTYPSTTDGTYTLRIESRASGSASSLPLNYTVTLQ
ncbi:MAG: hypothetical protein WC700_12610 [Gemmatimonadaceae bacterium]